MAKTVKPGMPNTTGAKTVKVPAKATPPKGQLKSRTPVTRGKDIEAKLYGNAKAFSRVVDAPKDTPEAAAKRWSGIGKLDKSFQSAYDDKQKLKSKLKGY